MKNIKKVLISIMLIFMLFPTVIFAATTKQALDSLGWVRYDSGVITVIDTGRKVKAELKDITIVNSEVITIEGNGYSNQIRKPVSNSGGGSGGTGGSGSHVPTDTTDTMFDYEKYVPDWLKETAGITGGSGETAKGIIIQLAVMIYDLFFIASLAFFGFKFIDALYLSFTRSQHTITKNQLTQEVFEPIKGLMYFVFGLLVIRIFLLMLFPEWSAILGVLETNL